MSKAFNKNIKNNSSGLYKLISSNTNSLVIESLPCIIKDESDICYGYESGVSNSAFNKNMWGKGGILHKPTYSIIDFPSIQYDSCMPDSCMSDLCIPNSSMNDSYIITDESDICYGYESEVSNSAFNKNMRTKSGVLNKKVYSNTNFPIIESEPSIITYDSDICYDYGTGISNSAFNKNMKGKKSMLHKQVSSNTNSPIIKSESSIFESECGSGVSNSAFANQRDIFTDAGDYVKIKASLACSNNASCCTYIDLTRLPYNSTDLVSGLFTVQNLQNINSVCQINKGDGCTNPTTLNPQLFDLSYNCLAIPFYEKYNINNNQLEEKCSNYRVYNVSQLQCVYTD
jgi:hypothetical protein